MHIIMKNFFNKIIRTYSFYGLIFVLIVFIWYPYFSGYRPYTRRGRDIANVNWCKSRLKQLGRVIALYKAEFQKYPANLDALEKFYAKKYGIEKDPRNNLFYCPASEKIYLYINEGDILVMDSCYCNDLKKINILLKDGTIITAKKEK